VLKDYDANLGFDISQHGEYRKLMEFNNSGSRTISQPVDERILIVIALMDLLDRAAVEHKEELERLIPGYIFDEDLPNYRPRLSEGHKYVVDIGTDEEKKYLVVENAVLKPLLKVRTAIFDNEEDVEGHRFVIGGWLA
jgi:hypothetical protein